MCRPLPAQWRQGSRCGAVPPWSAARSSNTARPPRQVRQIWLITFTRSGLVCAPDGCSAVVTDVPTSPVRTNRGPHPPAGQRAAPRPPGALATGWTRARCCTGPGRRPHKDRTRSPPDHPSPPEQRTAWSPDDASQRRHRMGRNAAKSRTPSPAAHRPAISGHPIACPRPPDDTAVTGRPGPTGAVRPRRTRFTSGTPGRRSDASYLGLFPGPARTTPFPAARSSISRQQFPRRRSLQGEPGKSPTAAKRPYPTGPSARGHRDMDLTVRRLQRVVTPHNHLTPSAPSTP
ncbi:hypothetical protein Ga0074812_12369 [Parafrankia irregularis]|uniref:Uncharacterized protein n=1 Tax=Parafrankia irregularis TaxID=795642 RepID=A0A0S4QVN2_9ACTN|nr:hypothetical protein Ga0074812_12369 [Parafrankia irregularis]